MLMSQHLQMGMEGCPSPLTIGCAGCKAEAHGSRAGPASPCVVRGPDLHTRHVDEGMAKVNGPCSRLPALKSQDPTNKGWIALRRRSEAPAASTCPNLVSTMVTTATQTNTAQAECRIGIAKFMQ